ncbi:hypothetical protein CEXT_608301 [Caerostris extrusa]|uniref:Uncharacterized protein n=1 Tax=Caerostris extrusa TaxID=172846 RepID=A0AAV4T9F7_CAEEX|nr:hypothetical protein CEXT_608301 [Caerostris extrusa]
MIGHGGLAQRLHRSLDSWRFYSTLLQDILRAIRNGGDNHSLSAVICAMPLLAGDGLAVVDSPNGYTDRLVHAASMTSYGDCTGL